ncbi:hypothetical protein BB558_004279 [Smittium angustum]|uniref:Sensitive to high expression protein 9, mitochondrial n=2 Tax=Smittium angustum TaxID=133377 RepID=A0A2U1J3N9_SMIAN|nr:hypothetical protein BB558_004279 [Smittium angustum]
MITKRFFQHECSKINIQLRFFAHQNRAKFGFKYQNRKIHMTEKQNVNWINSFFKKPENKDKKLETGDKTDSSDAETIRTDKTKLEDKESIKDTKSESHFETPKANNNSNHLSDTNSNYPSFQSVFIQNENLPTNLPQKPESSNPLKLKNTVTSVLQKEKKVSIDQENFNENVSPRILDKTKDDSYSSDKNIELGEKDIFSEINSIIKGEEPLKQDTLGKNNDISFINKSKDTKNQELVHNLPNTITKQKEDVNRNENVKDESKTSFIQTDTTNGTSTESGGFISIESILKKEGRTQNDNNPSSLKHTEQQTNDFDSLNDNQNISKTPLENIKQNQILTNDQSGVSLENSNGDNSVSHSASIIDSQTLKEIETMTKNTSHMKLNDQSTYSNHNTRNERTVDDSTQNLKTENSDDFIKQKKSSIIHEDSKVFKNGETNEDTIEHRSNDINNKEVKRSEYNTNEIETQDLNKQKPEMIDVNIEKYEALKNSIANAKKMIQNFSEMGSRKIDGMANWYKNFAKASKSGDLTQRLYSSINFITGYDRVAELKRVVVNKGLEFSQCRKRFAESKDEYEKTTMNRSTSQKEINLLLQRKHLWDESDVVQFTTLYKQEHELLTKEKKLKAEVKSLEAEVDVCYDRLVEAIQTRYHEEQTWSDKIRMLSSYSTWTVLMVNILAILLAQLVFEPRRRQKIIDGVDTKIFNESAILAGTQLDQSQNKLTSTVDNGIKQTDEYKNVGLPISNSQLVLGDKIATEDLPLEEIRRLGAKIDALLEIQVNNELNKLLWTKNLDNSSTNSPKTSGTKPSIKKAISLVPKAKEDYTKQEMLIYSTEAAVLGGCVATLVLWFSGYI